ncbi:MAG: hypothetical protein HY295_04340 [Thaumarchaeota archaeon]|nr:hypothetical protein [Nitrososphaerota archaeon]
MPRTYEYFKEQVNSCVRELLDNLRSYCLSFGSEIVEEANTRNLVYQTRNNMDYRSWFLNFLPQEESIIFYARIEDRMQGYELSSGTGYTEFNLRHVTLDEVRKIIRICYNASLTCWIRL